MTFQMPPIRPSRLTRLANRLGCRRAELVAALWAIVALTPVAITAVILWTVPVPQTMRVPFDPAQPSPVIAISSAAGPAPPSPSPARTHAATAPRVVVRPAPASPSATRSAPRATPPATTAPPSTEVSTPDPTEEPTPTGERSTSPTPEAGAGTVLDIPS